MFRRKRLFRDTTLDLEGSQTGGINTRRRERRFCLERWLCWFSRARRVPHCGQRYAMPSTGVASPKIVTVTNAVSAPKPTAWLRNWMSLFGAPPGTLMSPTAVQADTSLGSVVIWTVYVPSPGPVVLTHASSINTSARTTLADKKRPLGISHLGLEAGIALVSGSEIARSVFTGSIGLPTTAQVAARPNENATRAGTALHQGISVHRITAGPRSMRESVGALPPSLP
jgi:hypothetical protein